MHPDTALMTDLLGDIERGLGSTRVKRLEELVALYLGPGAHCAALSNPAPALQLALGALGLRPGERVLLPALIEPQLVHPVLHLGAEPVFLDVHPHSLCPDPGRMRDWIESRALRHSGSWFERESGHRLAAFVFANRDGLPAPVEEYHEIAGRYGLRLVECCAAAEGAGSGPLPDIRLVDLRSAPFGLDSGALLISQDADLRRSAVHWAELCATNSDAGHDGFGFQYRLSALLAGLAAERFERWQASTRTREEKPSRRPRKLWRLPGGENVRQFSAHLFEHGWTPLSLPPCLPDQELYSGFAGEATPEASQAAQHCLLAERRTDALTAPLLHATPGIPATKGAHA